MLSRSSLLFAIFAATSAVFAGPIEARQPINPVCFPKDIEPSCLVLVGDCIEWAVSTKTASLWTSRSCVAAATCFGVGNLEAEVACEDDSAVTNQAQTSLDYTIYASIVGDCAYATKGCPITQQNYIDFYYGSLSALGATIWPSSSSVVIAWWQTINDWTATGSTIPYTHFNDWLHYSTYPPPFTTKVTVTPTTVTLTTPTAPTTVTLTTPTAPVVTITSTLSPVVVSTFTSTTPTVVTATA